MTFSLKGAWNASAETEPREYKERDYLYASELGKPLVDKYLSMIGKQPSNPPNARALRKMWAGNVWEFVAGVVLFQLGIVHDKQQRVGYDGLIRVSGKLDYMIGGVPNYDRARDDIKKYPFQPEMMDRFMRVIDRMEEIYGNEEIPETVHEIKSCSEYVVDKIGGGGNIISHDLQLYHYVRGLGHQMGIIDYISKNDALMEERQIIPTEELKNKYEGDIALLKGYLDAGEQPPPAPLIVWDGKFTKNFDVEYSNYLSVVYRFDTPEHYRNAVDAQIARWNRVLGRVKEIAAGGTTQTGKELKLTDKNKESIEEMQRAGHNVEELAARYKEDIVNEG